ncbi:alpha/beta hydrolase [Hymenobacter sp. BT664]|uniref:Alpha/beta hydrolase n=1 Tax=Hymenobacter montanus TaxID=2771359 RepID=A0A927BAH7_9BACT|nr:alpha/beta hydrolase [Hymenobacter montanus]MBD2766725.1 alpha/beta hydrolase [Hymenobacter montanus]
MKILQLLLVPSLVWGAACSAPAQQTFPLYTGIIPNAKPSELTETSNTPPNGGVIIANVVQPSLTAFLPAPSMANGTAVIICPGGGYACLSIDNEGSEVARRLNQMGITAFVLKYRLPNEQSQPDPSTAPLLDVQQALRLVRQQAAKYSLNPERIGVMGFSAGGHLAAAAATRFARPLGGNSDPVSVRPAFSVLIYPVISFSDSLQHAGSREHLLGKTPSAEEVRQYSNEKQVTAQTPPIFLVHAQDDKVVSVQNSIVFYQACLHHGVPAEMHLYPHGGHGFGLQNKTTKDQWLDRLQNWLDANGWLTKQ